MHFTQDKLENVLMLNKAKTHTSVATYAQQLKHKLR